MMTGTGYARSRRDKEEEETREEVPTQKRELKAEKAKTRGETESLPKGRRMLRRVEPEEEPAEEPKKEPAKERKKETAKEPKKVARPKPAKKTKANTKAKEE